MNHPFAALAGEYATLLARMTVTRPAAVDQVAARLLDLVKAGRYGSDADMFGIPAIWRAASFEREASSDFRCSPAQGDRWNQVSVHVPKGRGPFASWQEAARDAYRIDHLDQVGAGNWTWERACFEGELFNGFGYRSHGVHSPYLWAGTNIYDRGKYTGDGHWDPGVRDQQLGIVPLMARLAEHEPSLMLPGTVPGSGMPLSPVTPKVAPAGVGQHDVRWLQAGLNKLDNAGLTVDGSYGRNTRRAVAAFQHAHGLEADGFAGPLTLAALEKVLA